MNGKKVKIKHFTSAEKLAEMLEEYMPGWEIEVTHRTEGEEIIIQATKRKIIAPSMKKLG